MKGRITKTRLNHMVASVLRTAARLRTLNKRAPEPPWAVAAAFITQDRSKELCKTYLQKPGPTDVLSFPPAPGCAPSFLGDLAICLPVARSQARALGHSLSWELRVLIVHGVLHLLGFDHERGAKKKAEMHRLEKQILKALGGSRKSLIGRSRDSMLGANAHSHTRSPLKTRLR